MTLPRDLFGWGIRVVTIAPGILETPLLPALPDDAKASLVKQVSFPPRLGRPSELAGLVGHVLENPLLSGETIRSTGPLEWARGSILDGLNA